MDAVRTWMRSKAEQERLEQERRRRRASEIAREARLIKLHLSRHVTRSMIVLHTLKSDDMAVVPFSYNVSQLSATGGGRGGTAVKPP